jgi:hypothetical protein
MERAEHPATSLEFGKVLSSRSSERRVWLLVVPAVLGLAALVGFAGLAMSRTAGLRTRAELAEKQAAEASRTVEERDRLLAKARADEAILRSPGRGAAVLAPAEGGAASGFATWHPEQRALKLFAFGLAPPPEDREYRVEARAGEGEPVAVGTVAPDERGGAFLVARELPEGAREVRVVLAPKDGAGAAAPAVVLSGSLPRAGESGLDGAAPVQARSAVPRRRGAPPAERAAPAPAPAPLPQPAPVQ